MERDLKDYLLVGAAAPPPHPTPSHPCRFEETLSMAVCANCLRNGPSTCPGISKCPAATGVLSCAPLPSAPLLPAVPACCACLLQEARRAVGGGVKVQYVSLNKDSHVLEVPEVSLWGGHRGA